MIPSVEPNNEGSCERGLLGQSARKGRPLAYEFSRHCGSIEILQFLDREGSASVYLMSKRLTPTHTAIERALRWLLGRRLVECSPAEGFPFTKTFRLTEYGRAIVESPVRSWSEFSSD